MGFQRVSGKRRAPPRKSSEQLDWIWSRRCKYPINVRVCVCMDIYGIEMKSESMNLSFPLRCLHTIFLLWLIFFKQVMLQWLPACYVPCSVTSVSLKFPWSYSEILMVWLSLARLSKQPGPDCSELHLSSNLWIMLRSVTSLKVPSKSTNWPKRSCGLCSTVGYCWGCKTWFLLELLQYLVKQPAWDNW